MNSFVFGVIFLWSLQTFLAAFTPENEAVVGFKCSHNCKKYHSYHSTDIHDNIVFPDSIYLTKTTIKYPYAAMMFTEAGVEVCGGVLISTKFVIIAAHCLYNRSDGHSVILGQDPLKYRKEDIIRVAKRIIHPDYTDEPTYNDIALLELERSVRFSNNIQPACLQCFMNFSTDDWLLNTWWLGEELSLKEYGATLLGSDVCHSTYAQHKDFTPYGIIDYLQMCIEETLKDVNDSSHLPIALAYPNKGFSGFTVVGIPSLALWGEEFAKVYTRVSSYIDWIESIVWSEEDLKNGCSSYIVSLNT